MIMFTLHFKGRQGRTHQGRACSSNPIFFGLGTGSALQHLQLYFAGGLLDSLALKYNVMHVPYLYYMATHFRLNAYSHFHSRILIPLQHLYSIRLESTMEGYLGIFNSCCQLRIWKVFNVCS